MGSKIEIALQKHRAGYNCTQAVACTYCEDLGFDEMETYKSMEAFGFGMGSMSICGAISGACALVGMKLCDGSPGNSHPKRDCYKMMKKILREFDEMNTSTMCSILKGVGTKKILRSCDGCVVDAAYLVEKHLFEMETEPLKLEEKEPPPRKPKTEDTKAQETK